MKCCVEPNLMPHSDQPFMLAKRSLHSLAVRRRALIPVIRAAAGSWRAPRSRRRRGTRFASSAATHSRLEHPIPGTIVCVTFRHRRIEMWPDYVEQDGMAEVKKPPTFAPLGTYQQVIAGANHNPLLGTKQCIQSQDISRVYAFLLSLQADWLGSHSLEWLARSFQG